MIRKVYQASCRTSFPLEKKTGDTVRVDFNGENYTFSTSNPDLIEILDRSDPKERHYKCIQVIDDGEDEQNPVDVEADGGASEDGDTSGITTLGGIKEYLSKHHGVKATQMQNKEQILSLVESFGLSFPDYKG